MGLSEPRRVPSAREKHRADLSGAYRVETDFLKFRSVSVDFVKLHRAERLNMSCGSGFAALIVVFDHGHIRAVDLGEKSRLFRIRQLIVIAEKLLLTVFFKLCFCF